MFLTTLSRPITKYVLAKRFIKSTINRIIIRTVTEETEEKKGLILGVYVGDEKTPVFTAAGNKFNDKVGGKLHNLISQAEPKSLTEGHVTTFHNLENEYWSVAVVGLGKPKKGYCEIETLEEDLEAVRVGAATGARKLRREGVDHIRVDGFGYPEQAAEGSALAVWRYQENKSKEKWRTIPTLELFDDPDTEAWQRGLFKAEAQNLARRLTDTPANQMTPSVFAQQAINVLCPCGIKVEVHDKEWIKQKKMGGFLAMAQGSCEPPLILEASYTGGPSDQHPVILIGQGVTFDAGGISFHDCKDMNRKRADMSGAAVVVAVIRAAAALNLPLNIMAIAPLCENMPSGMAVKPGDIVFNMDDKSINIQTTRNKGRVILADTLSYAQKAFNPRLLIDIATMTPGVKSCLGTGATGVFCNSQNSWDQLKKSGAITGDRVVRLPLYKFYKKCIKFSESYDLNNEGVGHGDSCIAAAFLSEFVNSEWIHMDTTGVGMKCSHEDYLSYYRKGRMTGRPVRTLVQFLYQIASPK